ncbi:unnamed protein product [Trichogramma brassicae]|uniref:Uncharacterized protein n=1 Tax=Trichogramma brassicae TaxID=86971 RepID=A0A6H5I119_9HYME|nr:unnamed protein product [Trichogramma brassicae]
MAATREAAAVVRQAAFEDTRHLVVDALKVIIPCLSIYYTGVCQLTSLRERKVASCKGARSAIISRESTQRAAVATDTDIHRCYWCFSTIKKVYIFALQKLRVPDRVPDPPQQLVFCDRVLERGCESLCKTLSVECLAYPHTGFLYRCFCKLIRSFSPCRETGDRRVRSGTHMHITLYHAGSPILYITARRSVREVRFPARSDEKYFLSRVAGSFYFPDAEPCRNPRALQQQCTAHKYRMHALRYITQAAIRHEMSPSCTPRFRVKRDEGGTHVNCRAPTRLYASRAYNTSKCTSAALILLDRLSRDTTNFPTISRNFSSNRNHYISETHLYFKNLPVSRRSLNIEVKMVRSNTHAYVHTCTQRNRLSFNDRDRSEESIFLLVFLQTFRFYIIVLDHEASLKQNLNVSREFEDSGMANYSMQSSRQRRDLHTPRQRAGEGGGGGGAAAARNTLNAIFSAFVESSKTRNFIISRKNESSRLRRAGAHTRYDVLYRSTAVVGAVASSARLEKR